MKKKQLPIFFGTAYISIPCWVNLLHGIMINRQKILFYQMLLLLWNMLIILMKSFIYKQRVNKSIVGINGFISYLKYYQTIEKEIYLKQNMIQKFNSIWNNCKLV